MSNNILKAQAALQFLVINDPAVSNLAQSFFFHHYCKPKYA